MNKPKNTRMCTVCRERNLKSELIKIVVEDNNLKIDETQKQKTRSMYICKSNECIEKLCSRKNIETTIRKTLRNKTLNVSNEQLVNLLESQKRG